MNRTQAMVDGGQRRHFSHLHYSSNRDFEHLYNEMERTMDPTELSAGRQRSIPEWTRAL